MQSHKTFAAQHYSPLYFLAALGAGGLVVTFFMYLMFWVPHVGQPVPVFEDITSYFASSGALGKAMVAAAFTGIAVFAILHIWLLIWNLRQLTHFKRTSQHAALTQSNAEVQLKAVPLTLAMAVNVGFILGLIFVPGLWSVVEYLFPVAMIAFGTIGVFAIALYGRFLGRVLGEGGFDVQANDSFAQLLPAFALAMVGVGFAAPAAMSQTPWIVATALVASTIFIIASLVITAVGLVLAMITMLQKGASREAAPTLMIVVPIVTVLSIAWLRQSHGLHTTFSVEEGAGDTFLFLTRMLALQILFVLLGWIVMRRQQYARTYLSADGMRSAGSYALVCPGVALSVLLHFWVNKGLVATGLVTKFGLAYWLATTPALLLQIAAIWLVVRLHQLHYTRQSSPADAILAE